ncbi:MAG: rRNA adenine N-6-methyltransferase family protein [Planctomycetaceae bacterium]
MRDSSARRTCQNYLIDLNIIEFIVSQARLSERDVVLEVGTGTGA